MEKQHSSISSFKKFGRFLGSIFLLLAVIGGGLHVFFERAIIFSSEISGASKVNRILNESHSDEIPIFGSSRADGSYVPSILGEEFFNYGIDGTQAKIWLFFLEKELQKDKSSPVVINFDLEGFLYSKGDVGNYLPNYAETKHLLGEDKRDFFHIPFIKYFGHYESYLKDYLSERVSLTRVTDHGGSFDKISLTPAKFDELVQKRLKTKIGFSTHDDLMNKLDSLTTSTDRAIVFVVAPYHESYLTAFDGLESADHFLQGLNQQENLTVLDYRSLVQEDSLFLNTTHLNYSGARIFSQALKADLDQIKQQ